MSISTGRMLKSVVLLLSFIGLSLARDCSDVANFPYRVGQVFPISTQTAFISPDGSVTTRISGNIEILSSCSFQFKQLTLANAPVTAGIQIFGKALGSSSIYFPVSLDILSGVFTNEDGPVITLSGPTIFQVPNGPPGVSFADFSSLRIFSVPSQFVIADILLPTETTSTLPTNANGRNNSSAPATVPKSDPKAGSNGIINAVSFSAVLIVAVFMSL